MTAFRSTRSTGQAHQPAAGACRPSIRAGPGPTGSFRQQPRYSVRGGAGGGWGGGRGCSRWSQFALCSDSTPTGSHLRWVLCPDKAKWDDECPATHTHTHTPTPTPTTRNGGSTPAPWCHGPAASGPASPRSEKTCCRASHVPTPSPASWPGCGRTAEAWAGAGWRGGGGGRAENSEELWCRRHQGAGRTRGRGRAVSQRTFTHTHTHTSGTHRHVPVCARVCPQPHLPPPHTHTPPPPHPPR